MVSRVSLGLEGTLPATLGMRGDLNLGLLDTSLTLLTAPVQWLFNYICLG